MMGRQRPFDFFAWNSRSFDANVTSRYFSINNGVTDLDDLNTSSAALAPGGAAGAAPGCG